MTSQFDLEETAPLVWKCVKAAKGIARLAKICGINSKCIYSWKRVPEHHLDVIHRELGIHPMELRPDVFDPERLRLKAEFRPDNKSRGPRRRKYKYKRHKLKPEETNFDWLTDRPVVAFTPRGKRLAGVL